MVENAFGFMMKLKACVTFLLFSLSFCSFASIPVHGTLQARESCPAYLSKNYKTNPDDYHLAVNEIYVVVEINKASQADWYRVTVPKKSNPLRWVKATCGYASGIEGSPTSHCNKQPGHEDSYILALSWQPAFCETYGYERGKAECHSLTYESYTATHLSLHGFWPNQKACGTNYGYCQTQKRKRHCDYPSIQFTEFVGRQLGEVMPSYTEGSCLERHEWYKHGSCQFRSQNDYFDTAIQLASRFDKTSLGNLLRQFNGGYVSEKALKQAFIDDFGSAAIDKLYLGCQQGMLVDIWVSLPSSASISIPIKEMVQKAPKINRRNRCPKNIYISDFFT